MKKDTRHNKIRRTVAALVLVCGLLLPMAPHAQADGLEVKKGKVTIYQYDWVNSYEKLISDECFPEEEWVDVLLAWENTTGKGSNGDGTIWYMADSHDSSGKKLYTASNRDSEDFSMTASKEWSMEDGLETFHQKDLLGNFRLRRNGGMTKEEYCETDGGKKDTPLFDIALYDSKKNAAQEFRTAMYGKAGFGGAYSIEYHSWLLGTSWPDTYSDAGIGVKIHSKESQKNDSKYRYGSVELFSLYPGQSYVWNWNLMHKNNAVEADRYSRDDWDKRFRLYIRTRQEYDAFVDDIVVDGTTFRVDDRVVVPDDVTITVKDGGVMVVSDHLMLNGRVIVEEGGTVILNEGAAVGPFCTESETAGSFDIRGGNVIVMDGAKLVADKEHSYFYISRGGSLINRGIVVAKSMNLSDQARFVNEADGYFAIGFSAEGTEAVLRDCSVQQVVDRLTASDEHAMVNGRLDISGRAQLINRGVTQVFYESLLDGTRGRVVEGYRTENTVCRNEGEGSLVGSFGYGEKVTSVMVRFRPWPNGWPDITIPDSGV